MKDVTPQNGPETEARETPRWTVGQLVWGPMYDRLPVGSVVRDTLGVWPARTKVNDDQWCSDLDPADVTRNSDMSLPRTLAYLGRGAATAPEKWVWTKGDVVLFCDGDVWQRVNDSDSGVWRDTDGNSVGDEHVTAEMTDCRGRALVCQASNVPAEGA